MQDSGVLTCDGRASGSGPFYPAMTFTAAGLALGRGTLLAAFAKDKPKKGQQPAVQVFRDGDEARALSLLAAAYGRPLAESGVQIIRLAGRSYCSGQKMLARFYLSLIGLPGIGEMAAYRLFRAERVLEKGAHPSDLLKALGFPEAARDLEKYNPDQLRVPAGSGHESGRWTSGESGGSSAAAQSRLPRKVHVKPFVPNVVGGIVSDIQSGRHRTGCAIRAS